MTDTSGPHGIETIVSEIGQQLTRSQAHLLERGAEQAHESEGRELVLPRTLRQRVSSGGKSALERVGETRTPLSSLIPSGAFQVVRAGVELPLEVDDGVLVGSAENPVKLNLEFEFLPFENLPVPVSVDALPSVSVTMSEFLPNRDGFGGCTARGTLTARDADGDSPLSGERVLLQVTYGSVSPATARLSSEGTVEFTIRARCRPLAVFETELVANVLGVERTLQIRLEAERNQLRDTQRGDRDG